MTMEMTGTGLSTQYNYWLVALSIAIAISASYAALEMAGRVTFSEGRGRAYWLAAGATVMGIGIWSMHYIGMLALALPIPVFYDVPTVTFSAACAILASGFALFIVSRREMKAGHLLLGGMVMGAGIAGMHYSGMAAMRLTAHCSYSAGIVALSLLIAILVSVVALWIAFRLRNQASQPLRMRLAAAAVMGLAVASMHYTGMAATSFHAAMGPLSTSHSVAVSDLGIAGLVLVTFFVLGLAIIGALLDRNFSSQKGMLSAEKERWDLLMAQDGVFDADLTTGKAFHSPRWLEMIGYLPGELPQVMDTWLDRIHPEDKERVQSHFREYLEHGCSHLNVEYRLLHRDGTWLWILTRGRAVWDKDGLATRIIGTTIDISDGKAAEAKLHASEMQFGAFMRNAPALAFMKDAEGRLVYTNPTFDRKWNLKPAEWLGLKDCEIWPAELAAKVREVDLAVLSSDTPVEVMDAVPMPDGSLRQFLCTKFAFDNASGNRVLAGMALDITDRIEAEKLVQASEARYREMFERNPLPSWIYDTRDLRILEVNASAVAHYGWSADEFVNLSVGSICMQGEVEALEADLSESSALCKLTRPWRHHRKDGSVIWVELLSYETTSAHGSTRLVISNDVTSRINAEAEVKLAYEGLEILVQERTAALQISEMRWRGLIEATPQFVRSATPDGSLDYVNQQFLDYAGLTLPQMQGFGWLDIVHPDDRERAERVWATAIRSGQPYEIEYRFRSKEGKYRWFKGRGVPVRDSRGRITQWFGICTDIDVNKRSEEELEVAVGQRTAELAEARDQAQLAARSKGQFLASMSHEIRTPMNGIIGMSSLLADTPLDSQQLCYLGAIQSSGHALLSIINDILDFSKMEAGKLELEETDLDLQTVIEETTELVAASATAKTIGLSFAIAKDTPLDLLGDPGRLRQILLNLLSNGVKFTERGAVTLSVASTATSDSLHVLRFEVKDSGIGIAPDQQAGLFQAFAQADASTTRRFGGTGLGLSIAKRLVTMMKGS